MADPRKTPWLVLGLDPAWFPQQYPSTTTIDQATRSALVRRAYRRALLQHHPDKQLRTEAEAEAATAAATAFTVDDIKAAYAALGGEGTSFSSSSTITSGALSSSASLPTTAATGLEVVDLDELPYDEAAQTWYRSCRCGNARGYVFGERDLEEELDAEAMESLVGDSPGKPKTKTAAAAAFTIPAGELLVGCQDCSLWLCVHFAVAPDGGEDADDDDGDDGEEGLEEEEGADS